MEFLELLSIAVQGPSQNEINRYFKLSRENGFIRGASCVAAFSGDCCLDHQWDEL